MILPPEPSPEGRAPWSRHHLRLHRLLRRHPALLPRGASLLLAVSGGQDSMALTGLLLHLSRLHHWRLVLWHGDHRWREESAAQAAELERWAVSQGLPIHIERAGAAPADEAAARDWRYSCLGRQASGLGCRHVVTGHTANDRAETLLANLARGSHRRGLASLPMLRPLGAPAADGTLLVRPLLVFSREETGHICSEQGLPVWEDCSNQDPRFQRNRIRAEVMPVLEALHPGAARRISGLASRLEEEASEEEELIALALGGLGVTPESPGLARRRLIGLRHANRRRLLRHWLEAQGVPIPTARLLEQLSDRLAKPGSGEQSLAAGWRLCWDRSTLVVLHAAAHGEERHGPIEPGK